MKKTVLFLALSFVFTLILTAQITQEQADLIVQTQMKGKIYPFTVYAKKSLQTDGITILTSKGENFELNYSCWVYYVISYSTNSFFLTNKSYLIVKESSGNLLEINLKDTESCLNFEEWREMRFPDLNASILAGCEGKKSFIIFETSLVNRGSIKISYIDGELLIEHYDAIINCGFEVINVTTSFSNDTIDIYYWETPDDAECYCDVDFSYSAGKFESGTYRLVIHHFMQEVYNQIIILE